MENTIMNINEVISGEPQSVIVEKTAEELAAALNEGNQETPESIAAKEKAAADEQAAADKLAADAKAAEIAAGNLPIEETNTNYFDEKGNLCDDKGIILTSKELKDGGHLDDKGNFIDIETKEILLQKASDVPQLISSIQEAEGYKFVDNTGKEKTYSDDLDGIREYYNDVAAQKSIDAQNDFLESNPEIKSYALHILAGKDRESFFKDNTQDYLNLDVTKASDTDKESLAKYYFKNFKNLPDKIAESTVNGLKDSGELDDFIDIAQKELIDNKQKIELENRKIIEDNAAQAKIDDEKYWNNINTIVDSGNIDAKIVIPKNEINSFKEYISKKDANGFTANQIDSSKEDDKTQLKIAYLRYKKWNLDSFINREVSKSKVNDLRNYIAKNKNTNNNTRDNITGGKITDFSLADVQDK